MSKPSYMSQAMYGMLSKAIDGLDTASNTIDDALFEMEMDADAIDLMFTDDEGEAWDAQEFQYTLEDFKSDIEEISYKLWKLCGGDRD